MIIKPQLKGNVARNCHPYGCKEALNQQIDMVKAAPQIRGPKKVLILGASSGFGLAARVACAFGGPKADTIGVSVERPPSPEKEIVGSAGWFNNIFFREAAEAEGLKAFNVIGDAFSADIRNQVIDLIKTEMDGQVDLVIYSLASGRRTDADGVTWTSALKALGEPVSGTNYNVETGELFEQTVEPGTAEELVATVKVMGGEPWQEWIDDLSDAGVLAPDARTVAFSYLGPESTWPLYRDGTLGAAKAHLHDTANRLHERMAPTGGGAWIVVCKALVTKASAFIPTLPIYIALIYKAMKEKNLHEGCIEQMHRLLFEELYPATGPVRADPTRLIRVDDRELRDDIQAEVTELQAKLDESNFLELGDFEGYKREFLELNGFGFDNVDYDADISWEELLAMKP